MLKLNGSFRLLPSVTQGPSAGSLLKDTVWWHGSQEEQLGNLFNLLDFFLHPIFLQLSLNFQ